jgi:hypothetical protein
VDINEQVARLRQDVVRAQRRHAEAQHGLAQAEARRLQAAQMLHEEFGVGTPEAAEELASELEVAAETEISQARALLERAGGL